MPPTANQYVKRREYPIKRDPIIAALGIAFQLVSRRTNEEPGTIDVAKLSEEIARVLERKSRKARDVRLKKDWLKLRLRLETCATYPPPDHRALDEIFKRLQESDLDWMPRFCPFEPDRPYREAHELMLYLQSICVFLTDNELASIYFGGIQDVPSQEPLYGSRHWNFEHALVSCGDEFTCPCASWETFGGVSTSRLPFPADSNQLLHGELACALSLMRRLLDPHNYTPAPTGNEGPSEKAPPVCILKLLPLDFRFVKTARN